MRTLLKLPRGALISFPFHTHAWSVLLTALSTRELGKQQVLTVLTSCIYGVVRALLLWGMERWRAVDAC